MPKSLKALIVLIALLPFAASADEEAVETCPTRLEINTASWRIDHIAGLSKQKMAAVSACRKKHPAPGKNIAPQCLALADAVMANFDEWKVALDASYALGARALSSECFEPLRHVDYMMSRVAIDRSYRARLLVGYEHHGGFFLSVPEGSILDNKTGTLVSSPKYASDEVFRVFSQAFFRDDMTEILNKRMFCDCEGVLYRYEDRVTFEIHKARVFFE